MMMSKAEQVLLGVLGVTNVVAGALLIKEAVVANRELDGLGILVDEAGEEIEIEEV